MKVKLQIVLVILIAALAQTACAAPTTVPVTTAAPVIATAVPATEAGACPSATADLKLLVAVEQGYCMLYPIADVAVAPNLIVFNPISGAGDVPGDSWLLITIEYGFGRPAAEAADAKIAAIGPGFNITRTETQVGGQPAIVVDGLPAKTQTAQFSWCTTHIFICWFFRPGQPCPTALPRSPRWIIYTRL